MRFTRGMSLVLLLCSMLLPACSSMGSRSPTASSSETIDEKGVKANPAITPEVARAYERALTAMNAGRSRDAEAMLARLVREYPQLAGPHVNLGIIYYRSGRLQEAEASLKRALALNPSRADAYNHLGIVLRNSGRFEDARVAYEQALRLDPDYAYAHLNLGILHDLYLLKADRALSSYERYQQLQAGEDQEVSKWIVDLKRRVRAPQKTAAKR